MKNIFKKYAFTCILTFLFFGIISCEKDFTDINSSIISNTVFETNDTVIEITITPNPIQKVRTDGIEIGGLLGQYLLGVYNNTHFEKIEASIVTQLDVSAGYKVIEDRYITDSTSIHTELDTVILRIPFQATSIREAGDSQPKFKLDSVIGNTETPFILNIYENGTYLSNLDPQNPARINKYYSDSQYIKIGSELNIEANYPFKPNENDTVFYINRKLLSGETFQDTIKLNNTIPFARIPLKKAKFQEFIDKYELSEFASQDAFNNYFRGIILEARGNEGSLISLNLTEDFTPSIEVYYTHTITLNTTGAVIDTIKKNDSFLFSGIRNSIYKMTPATTPPSNKNFVLQGAAGSNTKIQLFENTDINNNGIVDAIDNLREKNWLINDVSLTFYIDKSIPNYNSIAPERLYLYKIETINSIETPIQIKDAFFEPENFGGYVETEGDSRDRYTFRITSYISDVLKGEIDNVPPIGIRVYNPTDRPITGLDTIGKDYNWNPKAVKLLNESLLNGDRRAKLKISYSKKK